MKKKINKEIENKVKEKRLIRLNKEANILLWKEYRDKCIRELVCPVCGKDMKYESSATRQFAFNYDCKCGYTVSFNGKGDYRKEYYNNKEVY